jgi:hypothetical protein
LGNSFLGSIDEVSVYNRALSAAEIQSIYNADGAGKCTAPTLPIITSQPTNQTVTTGGTAAFTALASGTPPLSYQWRWNGTSIAGATSTSLTLTNVQVSQAGTYAVVVTNAGGSVTSSNAMLTVNFPPAPVRVVSTSAIAGGSVTVPVVLVGNGNENALGFSLNFDPSMLTYRGIALGSDAAGATLIVNANQTGGGNLGVALALAAEAMFPSGTQELVQVSFTVSAVTNAASTTISFGDLPIGRQLSDPPGNALPATYTAGSVSIAATDFEGDVSPRPGGNKDVTITDWVLMGRYVARLDYPTNAAEFQRADCAPRSTLGDGAITVTDWVQAGRYAARLDPLTPVGGPTSEVTSLVPLLKLGKNDLTARKITVADALLLRNQTVTVSVNLEAQGNENALGGSLSFDPAVLTYTTASLGSGATGAAFNVNSSKAGSGQLGFALALGTGSSFAAGTNEIVKATFQATTAACSSAGLSLTDQPVGRQVSDSSAMALATTYVDGTITVNPLPSLSIARSGQNVTLCWQLWATNVLLQEAADSVLPGVAWSNLVVSSGVSNNQSVVTLPLSGKSKLYRLLQQ